MIDEVSHHLKVTTSSTFLLIIITYLFFEYISRFINFTFNQFYFDYFMKTKLQNSLTRKFMDKLARLDFAHLEDGNVRNLIAKIENTYGYRLPDILHTINALLYNFTALVLSMIIALRFSPIYFIVLGLVSAPVYYLRTKYGNMAFMSYSANAFNTNYLWYLRSIFTNFQTLSEMKIYNLRGYFLEKTKKLQDKILADYQKPFTVYTILSTISSILIPVAIFYALTNFISDIEKGVYSLGDFTFFLNTLFTFSGQISSILINIGSIFENTLFLNDYFKLLSIKNSVYSSSSSYTFPDLKPRKIVFENVSFSYQGSDNLCLNGINLTIESGQNVAIVGHNGAGKSTFIKLLFKFYNPTEGRILVDGIDLKKISTDNWYQHLGVILQDYARYFLTLRENVFFGNITHPSDEEIRKSLEKAQAEEIMGAMPKGFDQFLGRWFEGGIELSGGQWQKVAIARAIFRDAPILIMDEPTSNIDADSEQKIFTNLQETYKNKSLVFISHRFSTVRTADKIFVFEKGQVSEQGNHKELMKKNGFYAHIFRMQRKGYEEV